MQLSGFSPATVLRHTLTALLLATLIAGCSTPPGRRVETVSPVQQQARALEADGDYTGAARLYISAASRATAGQQQQALQLQAVASLIRGEDFATARRLLDEMPSALANSDLQQHFSINRAAIALADQHPVEALALLDEVAVDGAYAADRHRLRAEAYLQEFRYYLSARERVQLDPLLTDPEAQLDNQFAIWETLNRLTDAELQQLRTAPPPDPLSGWMELVELSRLYLQQPDALAEVTPHWQQRYPGHPAIQAFIPRLLESMSLAGQAPAHIALLLPLNGTLADAAAAVRDGVLAAYYDTPDTSLQPRLQIIDSGDTADSALAAYQQAVLDGAQFVIGPLRKEAVQALAMQPQLAVPVLALNQIDEPALFNPSLYQFGLAPEDEAREVARLAWREGYTRTIALLPESEWGERVYAAFAGEWQMLGGEILDARRYDSSKTDHGKLISDVLHLDNSKARHQQLSRQLGMSLEFEPRRRTDVDFFFLIASPNQARLIRPQLRFYRATTLSVYATSRVYSGQPNAAQDADMNGIIFCDMPWTLDKDSNWQHLQQTITEFWPLTANRYARLYALGIDAYRLAPYLGHADTGLFGAYRGVTGNLTLNSQGIVSRTLRCAEFVHGIPVLLEQDSVDAPREAEPVIR
ncbi:MAG: penicillin-binding protein activator [Gammaproteobacteria bacterium]|jgi:outer membrane PBP1 activator LpoA protein